MRKRLTWREFVAKMKRDLPTSIPVRVHRQQTPLDKRFTPVEGWDGYTRKNDNHFLVVINREESDLDRMKDTLMHEWAHVLTWDKDVDDHGPRWGKAYAKVYRTALGWADE